MFTRVESQPIHPLPENAIKAESMAFIFSQTEVDGHSRGIYMERGLRSPRLMTWGANHTRETVLIYGDRRFVWTGLVREGDELRDNFEEVL